MIRSTEQGAYYLVCFPTPARDTRSESIDPATITFSSNFDSQQRADVAAFANVVIRDKASCFGASTGARLALTEVHTSTRDEDGKLQARVVFETDVAPGEYSL